MKELAFSLLDKNINFKNFIFKNSHNIFHGKVALTWNEVPEADGGHGDEAEVEAVVEGPVLLPQHEEARAGSQVEEQKAHGGQRKHPPLAGLVGGGGAGSRTAENWNNEILQRGIDFIEIVRMECKNIACIQPHSLAVFIFCKFPEIIYF